MSRPDIGINSEDAGERAWLLQSPSADTAPPGDAEEGRREGTSPVSAVFIVVNAALGAGLLNFPAAFNLAGGVTSGVSLQMVMSHDSPVKEHAPKVKQIFVLPVFPCLSWHSFS